MSELRWGLIGAGRQGRILSSLRPIVAIASDTADHLNSLAEDIKVSLEHRYRDAQTMLDKENLDIVIVATPPLVRTGVTQALRAGCHVFCENPLATTLGVGKFIVATAKQVNKVVTVGEQWMFLPAILRMEQMIQAGIIGDLTSVTFEGKGGEIEAQMHRLGTHFLSVAIKRFTGHTINCAALYVGSEQGMTLRAQWDTQNQVPLIAQFGPGDSDVRRCNIQVNGTKGRLIARGGLLEGLWHSTNPYDTNDSFRLPAAGWQRIPLEGLWDIQPGMDDKALRDRRMNPTWQLLDGFEAAITGGINPQPPEDILPSLEALAMMYYSIDKDGRKCSL